MPTLQSFAPDTAPDTLLAALRQDGALILREAITPAQVDALHTELRPYVEATAAGRDSFTGTKTTRTGALVARSPLTRALIMDPRILALCDGLLKPNCERYQLHLGQLIRIMPGQEAQAIHRDRWAWGPYLKGIEPQLNTIWAVTDFRRENGATQVVPGSVDWPDDRQAQPHEITWAEMPRGSVIVYTGSVFHGGGANVSDTERWGLNLTYSLGWLRQEENQYLSCPPEIARGLDPALQALVGYAMASYALGYYSPPLPPGAGPELVPPDYALRGEAIAQDARFGDGAMLRAIAEKVGASGAVHNNL
ncbi:MAG TPA: phytanoyl-CoA dioxygenase [Alphaproteobacteria bacterium]|nr:phytanoyl-CoA dioxygenase [Alphaproteobacteria bacterium]HAJ46886.1 phytanoyl-CoA dioxygenase [Alphaproteobacteria bacterium]